MTDKPKSDPRKVHIGSTLEPRSNTPQEGDLPTNVVSLPTEIIDFRSEETMMFKAVEQSPRDKVRAVVTRCQTALRNKSKVDGDEKVNSDGYERHTNASERQTYSARSARRRDLEDKCDTIQKVSVTVAVVSACITVVIFLIVFNIVLYNWSHTP